MCKWERAVASDEHKDCYRPCLTVVLSSVEHFRDYCLGLKPHKFTVSTRSHFFHQLRISSPQEADVNRTFSRKNQSERISSTKLASGFWRCNTSNKRETLAKQRENKYLLFTDYFNLPKTCSPLLYSV